VHIIWAKILLVALPLGQESQSLRNRGPITEVIKFGSAVLGSHSETPLKYGKIEHENGLKFGPSSKFKI